MKLQRSYRMMTSTGRPETVQHLFCGPSDEASREQVQNKQEVALRLMDGLVFLFKCYV